MSILDAYRSVVEDKVTKWIALPSRTAFDLETLASWLGCAHTSASRGYCVANPEQPYEECEPVVLEALFALLYARNINTALSVELDHVLLDGLLRNERWRLQADNDTFLYEFVALVTRFCDYTAPAKFESGLHARRNKMRDEVAKVLNRWSGPLESSPKLSSESVADVFFGEAWVSIVRNVEGPGQIGDIILSKRPPFRNPRKDLLQEVLSLPDLDCAQ